MSEDRLRYVKVYNFLKNAIINQTYKIGDPIPSENELCHMHSVTRPTVRQALQKLVSEGYILKHQGKGSIVMPPKTGLGILSINSTTQAFNNNEVQTKFLKRPEVQLFNTDFPFQLSENEVKFGCIHFKRIRKLHDKPLLFEETYLPNIDLQGFIDNFSEDKSLFNVLFNHHKIEILGGEQKIWAIQATKEIAEILDIKPTAPVLHLKRKLHTSKNGFFLYSFLYCNTESYYLQGEF
ncbi:MAG: GntR family transcriptional regulator [Bacteroidota bacterium]|nr:GntR family transcriptional regulator [Bacteroidota bacterium]